MLINEQDDHVHHCQDDLEDIHMDVRDQPNTHAGTNTLTVCLIAQLLLHEYLPSHRLTAKQPAYGVVVSWDAPTNGTPSQV